jgi:PIN domain nuclease of toxin-antitoxin system
MLIARGRLDPGTSAGDFLHSAISARRLRVLPIVPEIAVLAQQTGLTHGDPADRLIVATAIHHGARLVTADAALRALKAVQTVW